MEKISAIQREVLNSLIDSCERRSDYGSENKNPRRVMLKINKKTYPDYYHVSDSSFRLMFNEEMTALAKEKLVKLQWQRFNEGENLEKIILCEPAVNTIYTLLNRATKKEIYNETITLIRELCAEAPARARFFYDLLIESLASYKSLPAPLRVDKREDLLHTLRGLNALLTPRDEEVAKRVLSVNLYKDSKRWQQLEKSILQIYRKFFMIRTISGKEETVSDSSSDSQVGSQVGSKAGSQAGLQAGLQASSKAGSQAGFQASSKAGSQAGLQASSQAGSLTDSTVAELTKPETAAEIEKAPESSKLTENESGAVLWAEEGESDAVLWAEEVEVDTVLWAEEVEVDAVLWTESENEAILSEAGIADNPTHIRLSGPLIIKAEQSETDLSVFTPDMGFPSKMAQNLEIVSCGAKKIIVIENLTTYYQYLAENQKDPAESQKYLPERQKDLAENRKYPAANPKDELVIYSGGFTGRGLRVLLQKIGHFTARKNHETSFHFWGDIDLGGFRIWHHLNHKTGIAFEPFKMDEETYKKHLGLGHPMTEKYIENLEQLLQKPELSIFHGLITLMLKHKIRVEQEAISLQSTQTKTLS